MFYCSKNDVTQDILGQIEVNIYMYIGTDFWLKIKLSSHPLNHKLNFSLLAEVREIIAALCHRQFNKYILLVQMKKHCKYMIIPHKTINGLLS